MANKRDLGSIQHAERSGQCKNQKTPSLRLELPNTGRGVEALRGPAEPANIVRREIAPRVGDVIDQGALQEPIGVLGGSHSPIRHRKPRFLRQGTGTRFRRRSAVTQRWLPFFLL